MYKIGECKILLRAHVELPLSFKLTTEEFHDGWDLVRTGNAERLRGKARTLGWAFVKSDNGLLQGGVGQTSQLAIASAVKLALRRVSECFNAAEVARIELTRYPWFFVASVHVYPYIIQQAAVLPMYDDAVPLSPALRPRRAAPYPHFARAVPELRRMFALPEIQGRGNSERRVIQTAQSSRV